MEKKLENTFIKLINKTWNYVKRILISFDQLLNTVFLFGYEDETLSSRFYRWSLKGGFLWEFPCLIVDTLFFFDKEQAKDGHTMKHCEKSFNRELLRTGFPLRYKLLLNRRFSYLRKTTNTTA